MSGWPSPDIYPDSPLTTWRRKLTDQLHENGHLPGLNFATVRQANASRRDRWHGEASWPGVAWSNAMCGEAGEAANVVKKMYRHESGVDLLAGGTLPYNTPEYGVLLEKLALEVADTVLYADLLAEHYSIDLGTAVATKFNMVSEDQGFPERLPIIGGR